MSVRLSLFAVLLVALSVATTSPAAAVGIGVKTFDFPDGTPEVWYLEKDIPGLITFDLRFKNGDHHLKEISVTPHDGFWSASHMLVAFNDVNSDDPFAGTVRWADLFNYLPRVVARTGCQGTCRLTFPRLAQYQQIFVLAGFSFTYSEAGTDHHVRDLAVVPKPYQGYVDVTLADNSGNRPYNVHVKYLVVPYGITRGETTLQGTVASGGLGQVTRPAGLAVLQGFRLAFTNGDHHLERLAVDLHADRVTTRWRDGNGDDPYTWWVSYATLIP